MTITIFFSWQNDTSTKEGRNLIERALQQAVKKITEDLTVEPAIRELTVDRDTQGVAGQPPIVDTIFKKINNAAVFVPDLTFIGTRRGGRPTPNPNVLIEYGWALNSLGYSRIVPVMNMAHGEPTPETMPFNIGHLRHPITYNCPDGADEETRTKQRNALAKMFESGIRDVLSSDGFKDSLPKPPEPLPFPAIESKDGKGRFRTKGQPIGIIDSIHSRGGNITSVDGGAMWLRVMPCQDIGKEWLVTELKEAASSNNEMLLPLNNQRGSLNYVRGADGFGSYGIITDNTGNVTNTTDNFVYAFTTGEVWAVDSYLINYPENKKVIPLIENKWGEALDQYARFLTRLGINPPYRWIAGAEGVSGRGLCVQNRYGNVVVPEVDGCCVSDIIVQEGVYDPGTQTAVSSLAPFFIKIYDSCGIQRV